MRIKKAGGKIFGAVLSAAEKKAMDMEINRQIVEADRRYADDIDAMPMILTLWCFIPSMFTLVSARSACGSSMTLSLPSMTALSSIIKCRTITHGSAKKC